VVGIGWVEDVSVPLVLARACEPQRTEGSKTMEVLRNSHQTPCGLACG